MIATFCQIWSLNGWTVWLVLGLGVVGALLTTGAKFPPKSIQLRFHLLLPGVMLALAWASRFHHYPGFFYKCYYAQLDVSFGLAVAFSCGFILASIRTAHWFCRLSGFGYALIATYFLFEAVTRFVGIASWFG